jgi:aminoglycoside/choline kinase family phosphotransferase
MNGGIELVGIPRLVAADDDHHVLLLEDMGNQLISLFDYLAKDSIRLSTLENVEQKLDRIVQAIDCLYRK